ncbi:NAD(P)/FAD-dependent oxidoreductase [Rhizorhabdus dicambivorans]|uniref:NAD(P)/FAD-dependent oxidoreductase n=1 Tax=Rhizorhabdus dicambivorans TaxID=1850238 RepID=A0A2A4FWS9_9SPHN|nr:NAD(P)/FAD-dependent oxidoreductase [Rhizorhabdus dicambivorans]ATE66928.1 NAD(P)/FAD-dependent oxidoreductase [Rhizorhabdus dicambivorans]PCE42202.1 NAD(P)/FAD-dependent oxidoreductase [Rhizorhabdus dicambivorans]
MKDFPIFDLIIIGAGAAGMMCALTAGQRGRKVLLLDHLDRAGAKILISGGGRCNFTNVEGDKAERYLSANPHFARSALGRYAPQDFIDLVEAHGIAWHEKTLGQLFCDGSAKQIVAMLEEECAKGGVETKLLTRITAISKPDENFRVETPGATHAASSLVIATGGPSIPKMGATGFAYDVARQFGLKVVEPRPALVPLTLGQDDRLFESLSGVSLDVVASLGKARFREAALFTHRGLSGPAILQISSYWRHGDTIALDLLPGTDARSILPEAKRVRPNAEPRTILREHFPDRLADVLADRLGLSGPLHEHRDATLAEAGARLNRWTLTPNGSEGFAKAEVTIGGVSTDGLDQRSLMARKVPGLHFIGEGVDVTGWLGGYNFQWAWASGRAAGEAA